MNDKSKTLSRLYVLMLAFSMLMVSSNIAHSAVFKGVQSGALSHTTTNGTKTSLVTLATAIDPNKAYLMFQSTHNSSDPGGSMIRGRILDASTLQFQSVYDTAKTMNIQWYVVEYTSGVTVQRGEVSQSSTTTNLTLSTPVTAVNQAFVTWSKTPKGSDSIWSLDDPIVGQLTSTSNVQFRANQANSSHKIWWQVVEYTDPADISVQTVTSSMGWFETDKVISISAVDLTKSFILSSFRTNGSGNDINTRMMSAAFNSSSAVRIRRNSWGWSDSLSEVVIQVVQLNDGTVVQGGESKITKGKSSVTATINAVNAAKSIAFASVQAVGGQNMGRVKYKKKDIVGEGAVRFSISSTQLTLSRDRSGDDTNIAWFVLDYSGVTSISLPTISGVSGSCVALSSITVLYSKDVEQSSAETIGNYQVTNPAGGVIGINSATRTSPDTVVLALSSALNDLTTYTVTVSNVVDLSGAAIVAGSTAPLTMSCNSSNSCASFFPDTVQGNTSSSYIKFKNTSRVINDPNNIISFPSINDQASGFTCNTVDCSTTSSSIQALGIPIFETTSTTIDVSESIGMSTIGVGGTHSINEIDQLAINGSANVTFLASANKYIINSGSFTGSPTITFNEGEYWFNFLEILGSTKIIVNGNVTIFVKGHFDIEGTSQVNVSGPAKNLAFVGYNKIHLKNSVEVHAVIYGSGGKDVGLRNSSRLFGAVSASGKLELKNSSSITYEDISAVKVGSLCGSGGATGVPDHYSISHSSPGITCEGAQITVTAHDASHNPFIVNSNTALTVTTTPTVGNIISTPVTIPSGSSSATFYLNQSTPLGNIDIDVTDGTATDIDAGGAEDPVFNFLDTGFRFYVGGNHTDITPIGVQVAGKSSASAPGAQTLTMKAIRTNTNTGACVAALQNTTTNVDIGYECTNPTTCTGSNLLAFTGASTQTVSRNNNGASLVYTGVNMAFDINGESPFSFNFADAGQIKLHAKKSVVASSPNPAFTLLGSSNAFWTRPDKLVVTAKSAGIDLNATTSSATPIHKAGASFDLQVTAVNTSGGTTANYQPGQMQFLLDRAGPTSGGVDGSLTYASGRGVNSALSPVYQNVTLTNFMSGVSTFAAANYSEVGLLNLDLQDSNYGNAGISVPSDAMNMGRFTPDHFTVSGSNGAFDKACGSFSYLGQDFGYDALSLPSLTIVAKNVANVTTANYTETGYQKLSTSSVVRVFPNQDNTQNGKDALTRLSVTSTPSTPAGTLSVGAAAGESLFTFNANDRYRYDKNVNAEVGNFTSNLTIASTVVQDSDGVVATNLPVSVTPTSSDIRYGRWVMKNAFGPETKNLTMPGFMEYLNASGNFVTNTADNCSSYIATTMTGTPGAGSIANITVGFGTSNFSYNSPLVSGLGDFLLTAPGSGNEGSVIFNVDHSAQPWSQYDWNGDGSLQNHPSATATFGQYRGNDRIIYWREVEN